MRITKTMFVSQLPEEVQDRIYADVKSALNELRDYQEGTEFHEQALSDALEGRLCDLSDTISIKPYLNLEI